MPTIPFRRTSERRFSAQTGWLQPHESFTDTTHITGRFDMTKPGAYFLHLSRKLPPELGGGEVVSNQIEIDVVE